MGEESDSNKEEYLEEDGEDYSLKIADGDDGSDYDSSKEKRKRKKGSTTRKKKTPKKKKKKTKEDKQVKVTVKLAEPSSSSSNAANAEEPTEQMSEEEEEIEEEKTEKRKRRRSKKIAEIDPNTPATDQLPVKFGTSQVVALGTIQFEKENYHNDRYIFPIGYKAEKNYMSYKNPGDKTVYICEILDGEEGPSFKITPADDDVSFTSSTPSGVWSLVIKKVNESRKKSSKTCTVSGPEYYGLSNSRVRQLIEMLPNADKCVNYKKKFSNNDNNETETTTEAPEAATPAAAATPKRGRKKKEAKEAKETETPKRKRSSKKEIAVDENEEEIAEEETKKKKKKVKKEEIEEEEEIIDEEMEEGEPTVDFHDPLYTDEGLSDPVLKIYREGLPILREHQFTNYSENIADYSGHNEKLYLKFNMYTPEEVQEIYKEKLIKLPQKVELDLAKLVENQSGRNRKKEAKEEKEIVEEYEKEETRSPIEILRSMWELPYAFVGFQFLRPTLKITEFDFDEFEDSLINPKECSGLLADIYIRLIKGPAIDRKTVASIDPKCDKWKNVLKNKLDSLPPIYWRWQVNPLILYDYYDLSPAWRLIIIKALMEWKFETNQRVYDYSRAKFGIDMLVDPIGIDRDGIKYWYYESIGKIFTELPASLESKTKPRWELKCSTKGEFEKLLNELEEDDSDDSESALSTLIASLKNIIAELPEPEAEPLTTEQKRRDREEFLALTAKQREEDAIELEKQHEIDAKEFEQPSSEPEAPEQQQQASSSSAEPSGASNNNENQTLSRSGRSIKKQDFASLADEDDLDDSKRSLRPRSKRKSYREADDEEKKNDKDAEFVLEEDEEQDEEDEDDYSEEEEEEEEEEYEDKKKSKAKKANFSKKIDFKNDPTRRNPQQQQQSFTNVSGVNFNTMNNRPVGNLQQMQQQMQQQQYNRNMMQQMQQQQRMNKAQTAGGGIMSGGSINIQNNLRENAQGSSNMMRNPQQQQQQQQLASKNALQQYLSQNPALHRQLLTALQNNPSQQQQILQALQMRLQQAAAQQQQANRQNMTGVQQPNNNMSNGGANAQQNIQNMSSLTPGQLNVIAHMNEYRKQQMQQQNQQNTQQATITPNNPIIGTNSVNNAAPTLQSGSSMNQPTILNPTGIPMQQQQMQPQNQSALLLQLLQQNTAQSQQQQQQQFQTFNPLQQNVVQKAQQQPMMPQMASSSQQPQQQQPQDQSDMDTLFLGEDSFV